MNQVKGRKYLQPWRNVGEKRGWVFVERLRLDGLPLAPELSSTGGCLWRIAA